MTTILDPLIQSPQLSRYVAQLRGLLAEAQQRREACSVWITEDHLKAKPIPCKSKSVAA